MTDTKWSQYWMECALGDFDAALAEALRLAPEESAAPGVPREIYIANMVRNHIEQQRMSGELSGVKR